MPKDILDYSNTIFYKIYCKDPNINDIYIGHTTDFIKRKRTHKQSCINPKSTNYKCKLYNVIRDNMGWDNWKMDIIAFHNCNDLHSAKKQEQYYFEKYNATLNSIEPLPQQKRISKQSENKIRREPLYCKTCNVYFNTRKLQEQHNKRPKHIKLLQSSGDNLLETNNEIIAKFVCEKCNFNCNKNSLFQRHLMTNKHITTCNNIDNSLICQCGKKYSCRQNLHRHKKRCVKILSDGADHSLNPFLYMCNCGKKYKHNSGLYRHKKDCNYVDVKPNTVVDINMQSIDPTTVVTLLKENIELKKIMIKQNIEIHQNLTK